MTVPRPTLGPDVIHDELVQLRRGDALAHPGVVRTLRPELQHLLLASQGSLTGRADEVPRMVDAIRRAIDTLGPRERLIAQTEFHLLAEHSHPTLGQRQESLATALGCTVRTVRRGGKLALDTLIMRIMTGTYPPPPHNAPIAATGTDDQARRHHDLAAFWGVHDGSRVDVVCSELPDDLSANTGAAGSSRFMRYGQFADLDALFYLRVRLARTFPAATVHDFAPREHYDADADTLIVIGHPVWNSKHQEFLADLPLRYDTAPDTGPRLVIDNGKGQVLTLRLAADKVVTDYTVVTRLTAGTTTVFLLAGCHSLGTFAAAKTFLHDRTGPANARYLTEFSGTDDFIMITPTRRVGSITEPPDLTALPPAILLTRPPNGTFELRLPIENHGES